MSIIKDYFKEQEEKNLDAAVKQLEEMNKANAKEFEFYERYNKVLEKIIVPAFKGAVADFNESNVKAFFFNDARIIEGKLGIESKHVDALFDMFLPNGERLLLFPYRLYKGEETINLVARLTNSSAVWQYSINPNAVNINTVVEITLDAYKKVMDMIKN